MEAPIILFLSSTSFHFPLDLHGILANEGAETKRFESLDDFLSTPDRHTPYVAVLEIGSIDDIDRAMLAYEWCEKIQPIAPCRTILLIASKNIQLGEKAARFGNAEVAHLPLPLKNLMFKLDLQKRLLAADQTRIAADRGKKTAADAGFSPSFVDRPPKLDRVLLVRGPGPKKGYWQEAGESPQGKIRWRWVSTMPPEAQTDAEKAGVSWVAESKVAPVYEEEIESWAINDPEADLKGFRKDKPVFSARVLLKQPVVEIPASRKNFAPAESAAEGKQSFGKDAPPSAAIQQQTRGGDPTPGAASRTMHAEESAKAGAQKFAQDDVPRENPPRSFTKEEPAASTTDGHTRGEESQRSAPADVKIERKDSEWTERKGSVAPGLPTATRDRSLTSIFNDNRPQAPRKVTADESEETPAADERIPEHRHQEEEDEDQTGYSVPFTSEGKISEGEAQKTPAAKYSARPPEHPRNQAEFAPVAAQPRAQSEREEQGTVPAEQAARPKVGAEPPTVAKRGGGEKPAPTAEPVPSASRPERSTPAQRATADRATSEKTEPAPAPGAAIVRPAPTTAAAPSAEAKTSVANEAITTEQSRRADGQVSSPGKEEIHIRSEEGTENVQTEVALEGTPEHRDDEVRVRSQGDTEPVRPQRKERAAPENYLQYRHFVTMTLEELNDRDSSWHPMHGYRIYLSANHRYYGVKDPAALLPLWVYEGELAPEFLEDKRAWKFYDRYPELYVTLDTLPPVVLDQIYVMAGRPPPGLSSVSASRPGVGVTEGRGTATGAGKDAVADPASGSKGLWGSVKSFFKRLFGG